MAAAIALDAPSSWFPDPVVEAACRSRADGATAAAAFAAAKEAGRTELDQRGLTANSARDQAKSLLDNVVKAATGAATAGVKSAKQEATGATAEAQPDSTGGTGDSVPPADPHSQVMVADTDAGDFRSAV